MNRNVQGVQFHCNAISFSLINKERVAHFIKLIIKS